MKMISEVLRLLIASWWRNRILFKMKPLKVFQDRCKEVSCKKQKGQTHIPSSRKVVEKLLNINWSALALCIDKLSSF